jgi:hypothetical protein
LPQGSSIILYTERVKTFFGKKQQKVKVHSKAELIVRFELHLCIFKRNFSDDIRKLIILMYNSVKNLFLMGRRICLNLRVNSCTNAKAYTSDIILAD